MESEFVSDSSFVSDSFLDFRGLALIDTVLDIDTKREEQIDDVLDMDPKREERINPVLDVDVKREERRRGNCLKSPEFCSKLEVLWEADLEERRRGSSFNFSEFLPEFPELEVVFDVDRFFFFELGRSSGSGNPRGLPRFL